MDFKNDQPSESRKTKLKRVTSSVKYVFLTEDQTINLILNDIIGLPFAQKLAQLISTLDTTQPLYKWLLTGEYTPGLFDRNQLIVYLFQRNQDPGHSTLFQSIVDKIFDDSSIDNIIKYMNPYLIDNLAKRKDINQIVRSMKIILALGRLDGIDLRYSIDLFGVTCVANWLLNGEIAQTYRNYAKTMIKSELGFPASTENTLLQFVGKIDFRNELTRILLKHLRMHASEAQELDLLFDRMVGSKHMEDLNFLYQELAVLKPQAPDVPAIV